MKRTSFWITGEPVQGPGGTGQRGPMYVEFLGPDDPASDTSHDTSHDTSPDTLPVVMVHGGGGQGTDYLITPDGRPGWAPLLAQGGGSVYVVDRPGHGRSPLDPALLGELTPSWGAEFLRMVFVGGPPGGPADETRPPHTQWPGSAEGPDDVFAQFAASQGPSLADAAVAHALERDRLVALLERIGPAVVMAHSAGGPGAFAAADARPDLVRALVAIETVGPPFMHQPKRRMSLSWGLAAAPLRYEPAVADPSGLALEVVEPGPPPKVLQAAPARTLPGLAQVPLYVVTAQVSMFRAFDGHLMDYLHQVGCRPTLVRLDEHGLEGNGHAMMLELNNDEVLALILRQLRDSGLQV